MAMMTKSSEFRFTGWHMLACMIAFFGVIMVVNFTMASFASRSWTGLVVKNSYVASQEFNDELAQAEAQHARGWRSDIAYENGQLSFSLFDQSGQPLMPTQIVLSIGRPAFEQRDRVIRLSGQNGIFSTPLPLEDGTWAVKVETRAENLTYRRDLRLFVSQGRGLIQ